MLSSVVGSGEGVIPGVVGSTRRQWTGWWLCRLSSKATRIVKFSGWCQSVSLSRRDRGEKKSFTCVYLPTPCPVFLSLLVLGRFLHLGLFLSSFLSLPIPSPSSVLMPSISLSSDQARSALGSGRARRRWFYEGDPAVLEFSSLNGKDRFEGSQSGKDCRCERRVLWRAWRSSTLIHRPRSCPLGAWDANSAHSRRQGSPKKVAWDNGASETLHDLN